MCLDFATSITGRLSPLQEAWTHSIHVRTVMARSLAWKAAMSAPLSDTNALKERALAQPLLAAFQRAIAVVDPAMSATIEAAEPDPKMEMLLDALDIEWAALTRTATPEPSDAVVEARYPRLRVEHHREQKSGGIGMTINSAWSEVICDRPGNSQIAHCADSEDAEAILAALRSRADGDALDGEVAPHG